MRLWKKLMCTARRKSPWLFHMNSGSCNGCDIEIIAALSPRYDAEQLGVLLQGSPRHADILVVTGPVTNKAVNAVKTVYDQVCGPKAVVAIGSCPATTNVYIDSRTLSGPLDKHIPVDVYVPGCPPRPDAIIAGVVKAAVLLAEREMSATADPSTAPLAQNASGSAQDDSAVGSGAVQEVQP
jgi:membrane-bound hydrogenase subunit mbhJ